MQTQSVVINFTGGIVSPGHLREVLAIAGEARVDQVRFGIRQQLIMEVPLRYWDEFSKGCAEKGLPFYKSKEALPNIVSSYPAAGVFTPDSWLREGVYKDIFDSFVYQPRLKVNICDSLQCFVPFYTGHINWVSSSADHFWHLFIRFPRTGRIYKWKELVYTNDLAFVSQRVEEQILADRFTFYGNANAEGDLLYQRVRSLAAYIGKPSMELPTIDFSLPYYEGFNRAGNQLWLGVYRRNENFPLSFLMDVCTICLQTRTGQLYTTPWKSIIIKNIDPDTRKSWDYVLGKYRINVRHAANELNWQVEDLSEEGLQLKRHIIRQFDKEDVRTYGLCFAVQTKITSSLYGSVVIRKQQTKNPHRLKSLERYDILYKTNFNPNAVETRLFREAVEKDHIGVYLVSLCKFYYEQNKDETIHNPRLPDPGEAVEKPKRYVYQCSHCYTVYDPLTGDGEQDIPAGTPFEELPSAYSCPLCSSEKEDYLPIEGQSLALPEGQTDREKTQVT